MANGFEDGSRRTDRAQAFATFLVQRGILNAENVPTLIEQFNQKLRAAESHFIYANGEIAIPQTGREPELSGARLGLTRSNLDIARDQQVWNAGWGRELEFPQVSAEQLRQFEHIWATASPLFLEPRAHLRPGLTLRDIALPGLRIRPPEYFFRWVDSGRVPRTTVEFPPALLIFEAAAKPNWQNGVQLYRDNDPRGPVVQELVNSGLINRGEHYSHVPPPSLFAISPDEWSQIVLPALAQRMQLEDTGAGITLTPYMVFNLMGNLFYPQLGQGTTGEWFADPFEVGYRLYGGYSNVGGLSYVSYSLTSYRYGHLGGRPLVEYLLIT